MSDTLEKTIPVTTDTGDHDLFAHYVRKTDLERAIFDGVEIKALCGKMWRPDKDYKKYPVCPDCKRLYEELPDAY